MPECSISLIIPVYNCEKYIERCLRSIAIQNIEQNIEIIIVDDGSTDRTVEICNSLLSQGSILYKVIRQKRSGVSVARNTGIGAAEGKYIIFIDGDDEIQVDSLSILFYEAEKNHADFVFGGFKKFNELGRTLWRYNVKKEFREERAGKKVALEFLNGKVVIRLGAFIILRQNIVDHQLIFREGLKYGEDIEYILRCLIYSRNVYGIENSIYNYYEVYGSTMDKVVFERFEFIEAFIDLEKYFLSIEDIGQQLLFSLHNFFIPYGIMYHIDELILKNISVSKIRKFLKVRKYESFLLLPNILNQNRKLKRQIFIWNKSPRFYGYLIYISKKLKRIFQDSIPTVNKYRLRLFKLLEIN